MTSLNIHTRRSQRGFTLVEILVTLVVISVGLLGVAALQLTTLRGNQDAYVRSQASTLASDILDRMRANPLVARSGAYDIELNETTGTSPDATATMDLTAWQTAIDQLLPGGIDAAGGRIERVDRVVTVVIQWTERSDGTAAEDDVESRVREFRTRSEI